MLSEGNGTLFVSLTDGLKQRTSECPCCSWGTPACPATSAPCMGVGVAHCGCARVAQTHNNIASQLIKGEA